MTKRKSRKAEATPKQLDIDLTHVAALQLRLKGYSLYEIAQELGFSSSAGARKAVLSAVRKVGYEPAAEMIKIHLQRIDRMLKVLDPKVLRGDDKAISTANRLLKRQADLMGLDAPVKVAATDPSGKHAGPLIILPPVDGSLPPAVEEQLKHLSQGDDEDGEDSSDTD